MAHIEFRSLANDPWPPRRRRRGPSSALARVGELAERRPVIAASALGVAGLALWLLLRPSAASAASPR